MEIAQLPPEEMKMFLDEYGIEEPSLNRMIRISYNLLGQQSFFTAGQDECRAWTVRRGATAPEAAGEIHSDLQKGFIRAEVVAYDDLMALGGLSEARGEGQTPPGRQRIYRPGWGCAQYSLRTLTLSAGSEAAGKNIQAASIFLIPLIFDGFVSE